MLPSTIVRPLWEALDIKVSKIPRLYDQYLTAEAGKLKNKNAGCGFARGQFKHKRAVSLVIGTRPSLCLTLTL